MRKNGLKHKSRRKSGASSQASQQPPPAAPPASGGGVKNTQNGNSSPASSAGGGNSGGASSPGIGNKSGGIVNNRDGKRVVSTDEAALSQKNYRLAKELSELRQRHRDETKNVTRLTMENMNLATRCREALGAVSRLKKELASEQQRSSEAHKLLQIREGEGAFTSQDSGGGRSTNFGKTPPRRRLNSAPKLSPGSGGVVSGTVRLDKTSAGARGTEDVGPPEIIKPSLNNRISQDPLLAAATPNSAEDHHRHKDFAEDLQNPPVRVSHALSPHNLDENIGGPNFFASSNNLQISKDTTDFHSDDEIDMFASDEWDMMPTEPLSPHDTPANMTNGFGSEDARGSSPYNNITEVTNYSSMDGFDMEFESAFPNSAFHDDDAASVASSSSFHEKAFPDPDPFYDMTEPVSNRSQKMNKLDFKHQLSDHRLETIPSDGPDSTNAISNVDTNNFSSWDDHSGKLEDDFNFEEEELNYEQHMRPHGIKSTPNLRNQVKSKQQTQNMKRSAFSNVNPSSKNNASNTRIEPAKNHQYKDDYQNYIESDIGRKPNPNIVARNNLHDALNDNSQQMMPQPPSSFPSRSENFAPSSSSASSSKTNPRFDHQGPERTDMQTTSDSSQDFVVSPVVTSRRRNDFYPSHSPQDNSKETYYEQRSGRSAREETSGDSGYIHDGNPSNTVKGGKHSLLRKKKSSGRESDEQQQQQQLHRRRKGSPQEISLHNSENHYEYNMSRGDETGNSPKNSVQTYARPNNASPDDDQNSARRKSSTQSSPRGDAQQNGYISLKQHGSPNNRMLDPEIESLSSQGSHASSAAARNKKLQHQQQQNRMDEYLSSPQAVRGLVAKLSSPRNNKDSEKDQLERAMSNLDALVTGSPTNHQPQQAESVPTGSALSPPTARNSRRITRPVSYQEPNLNSKIRQGHIFFPKQHHEHNLMAEQALDEDFDEAIVGKSNVTNHDNIYPVPKFDGRYNDHSNVAYHHHHHHQQQQEQNSS
mmetsp:Transcript_40956/g.96132  ORF Transcript_40956/g.96132 Transcript_40956/m.96132 type:complete len:988 (-) Transcript_40956:140-3103(-)|eukprot:CAMPEP_0113310368 /NCGR_PEP_ID=MMETSP0010_2-20120614/8042_1 /TAXON_ID=216773 ORGANISM="Corethron hystrix, Strain 308" /NCGR_SAMPLE_ID=MMETSP0010_2 /ASSEMBLY_ACC=CAM_ASM_000155 /LENGTH=987 /DNA_ID=CAMNT_0000165811 /DNA_START=161 /DNA_END=3124 /DNA_ORIENTATION=+ /assembly_acc=CAM_ASM_000155